MSLVLGCPAALASDPPSIAIWRLDCGEIQMNDASPLSDTGAYAGQARRLTDSCYLIQHDRDLLLWDAGLPLSLKGKPTNKDPISPTLSIDLTSQLAKIGFRPADVSKLGVSHYHFDHVGQAANFPTATLLIGARDWAALHADPLPFGADRALLGPWIDGTSKVDPIDGDRDIFGDGSVVILSMPGHTPGSQALLVRLPKSGPVLLSGDVVHLEAQWQLGAVPSWNTERADSLASMDRLRKTATTLGANIIVQHDPADISKLAAFPAASR
jgi:glyoxylase-like metal-dependent hydrolase (beta-lactamase superfamily II)